MFTRYSVNVCSYGSPLDDEVEICSIAGIRMVSVNNAVIEVIGALIANAPAFVYLSLSSFLRISVHKACCSLLFQVTIINLGNAHQYTVLPVRLGKDPSFVLIMY